MMTFKQKEEKLTDSANSWNSICLRKEEINLSPIVFHLTEPARKNHFLH